MKGGGQQTPPGREPAERKYVVHRPPLDAALGPYRFEAEYWGEIPASEWSTETHAHAAFLELHYVAAGEAVLEGGGRPERLRAGTILFTFPGEVHRLASARGVPTRMHFAAYRISLDPAGGAGAEPGDGLAQLVRRFLAARGRIATDPPGRPAGALLEAVRTELTATPPGWREAAAGLGRALLVTAIRLLAPGPAPAVTPPDAAWHDADARGDGPGRLAERAVMFLETHFREDPSIGAVARHLGVSVRTVQRLLFREGIRYRVLVQRARLEAARHLLTATDLPVKRICQSVGFARDAYFSEAFRRAYGMPPLKYRALRRV